MKSIATSIYASTAQQSHQASQIATQLISQRSTVRHCSISLSLEHLLSLQRARLLNLHTSAHFSVLYTIMCYIEVTTCDYNDRNAPKTLQCGAKAKCKNPQPRHFIDNDGCPKCNPGLMPQDQRRQQDKVERERASRRNRENKRAGKERENDRNADKKAHDDLDKGVSKDHKRSEKQRKKAGVAPREEGKKKKTGCVVM